MVAGERTDIGSIAVIKREPLALILTFLAFGVALFVDLALSPTDNQPVVYALPILFAASRLPWRWVTSVAIFALALDLVDEIRNPVFDRMWFYSFTALILLAMLVVVVTRRRELVGRLQREALRRAREAERLADQMTRVSETVGELSAAVTMADVINVILSAGLRASSARAGLVSLVSADGTALELADAIGYSDEFKLRYSRDLLSSSTARGRAIVDGEPVWIESHADRRIRFPETIQDRDILGDEAWAIVPMKARDRPIGVVVFSFVEPRTFSPEDRRLLLILGAQSALAIERARLYDGEHAARSRAEFRKRQLGFLAETTKILASSLDYELTLNAVCRYAVPFLGEWCLIYLAGRDNQDNTSRELVYAARDPKKSEVLRQLRDRSTASLSFLSNPTVTQAIQSGKPRVLGEVSDDFLTTISPDQETHQLLRAFLTDTVVIAPLVVRDRILGAMILALRRDANGSPVFDQMVIEELANRAAFAVDNGRLYRRARESVRLRDEFVNVAAHELKTPITSLRGFAQLGRQRLSRGTANLGEIDHAFDVIDQQSLRLSVLVSRLLDLAQIEGGDFEIQREVIDIRELVEDVAEDGRKNLIDHTIIVDGLSTIDAEVDSERIKQVVVQLLDNAVRYSPDGGEIRVDVACDDTQNNVQVRVHDQGPGIPPRERASLFDRFYRGDVGDHRSGFGLGLYLCRRIVKLHGGDIVAEFPPEGGTRFVMCLPQRERRMVLSAGSGV